MGWRLHIGRPLYRLRGRNSRSLPALSERFSERIPLHLGLAEKKKVVDLKVSIKFLTSGTLLLLAKMTKLRQWLLQCTVSFALSSYEVTLAWTLDNATYSNPNLIVVHCLLELRKWFGRLFYAGQQNQEKLLQPQSCPWDNLYRHKIVFLLTPLLSHWPLR